MALRLTKSVLQYAGCGAIAILLVGCGATQKAASGAGLGNDQYRDAIDVYSSTAVEDGLDPIASAAFWGTRYNTNQSDPNVAVKFSAALRKIGSTEESIGVMQKTAAMHPDNADVSLEYGKTLIAAGRAFEAVRPLENAVIKKPGDWRALSAYGVALDQIGEHDEAREQYDLALGYAPGEVMVLNNKGLSYALDGDLSKARLILRQASASAGADARIRQNFALVLALSGEMREAERLARSDLPPQVANSNIDFFRQLMNQPAYWEEYAAGADLPEFNDAPAAPLAPAPNQKLEEEPKSDEDNTDNQPMALFEAVPVAPVTNASAEEDASLKLKDERAN